MLYVFSHHSQTGYIMFSPVSVCLCLSVCLSACLLLTGLCKATDHTVVKFDVIVGHNPGPIDWILSDLDPRSRSLEVKMSK